MSSKQDIWMPLFVGDYLRDTTRLTTEKHGAYLLLIMDYWINGAPPDDDEVLSSITKMQLPAWRKIRPSLVQLFNVVDGFWHHKRIDEELLKAAENAERYATRAKKAADKRWNKDSTSNATSIPSSNASGVHEDMLTDATSPSPSSIKPTELTHSKETLTSVEPTIAASVCKSLKELNYLDINPSHPKLLAMLDAGAALEEFVNAAQTAKIKKFSYVLGMVEGMRKQAATDNVTQGNFAESAAAKAWRKTDAGILAKAKELKIGTQGMDRFALLSKIDEKLDREKAA
jgi:uncharacterized protein YdaU (DUF1376 family)